MKSSQLNQVLLDSFPELKDNIEEEISWQDGMDTGSHLIFGDVFTPFILEFLKNENNDILGRIAFFLEKTLKIDDEYASEVIYLSVLESIEPYFDKNSNFYQMLGPLSKKALEDINIFWNP